MGEQVMFPAIFVIAAFEPLALEMLRQRLEHLPRGIYFAQQITMARIGLKAADGVEVYEIAVKIQAIASFPQPHFDRNLNGTLIVIRDMQVVQDQCLARTVDDNGLATLLQTDGNNHCPSLAVGPEVRLAASHIAIESSEIATCVSNRSPRQFNR